MASLIFICPATRRPMDTEIGIVAHTLHKIEVEKLEMKCP